MIRRILTIDGGGIRGVFPASFLANLEKKLAYPIGQYFDLIVGTSTGGIIAIGLALGMKASEILELYEKRGAEIFPQTNWIQKKTAGFYQLLCGAKYDATPLKRILEEKFEARKLGEAKTRLMIPAWVAGRSKPCCIYKTAHHPDLQTDHETSVVDIAMGTAAAPTYLRQHITKNDVGLVDGGLWANNPTAIAVIEAISVLGWPANELKVLSVGCLEKSVSMKENYSKWEIKDSIVDFFTTGQSDSALNIAKILTSYPHKENSIYRISPQIPEDKHSLDDINHIKHIKGLGFDAARTEKPKLQSIFFGKPAEKFTPIHK